MSIKSIAEIDLSSRSPCRTVIIQLVHHCNTVFYFSLSTSMDSITCSNMVAAQATCGPDFLIAQQHLQAVADMLASTTFQAMDADPRADATASLSAIRAILSPESREIRAEVANLRAPFASVSSLSLWIS